MMFTQGRAVKALTAIGVRASNALVTAGPGVAGLGHVLLTGSTVDRLTGLCSRPTITARRAPPSGSPSNTLVMVHMLTSSPHPILGSFTECIGWKQWAGLTLFVIRISMEMIAEDSRKKFRKDPKNKGKIDDTGLCHPNYLGFLLGRTGI
ncbi:hypothetical protein DFH08DRAFT_876179 [Mycena albidolilacea]|uniref:Uncharacterized protein n=1 Tax=Mycena albidolilacea TaxID=1033008 RepID=A0AAD6ZTK8_9AGAR|nr:hypothetical protein DFH08DRAFT_876179 [Mycena albidolilacea]